MTSICVCAQNVIPNSGFEVWVSADSAQSWVFPSGWQQNSKRTLRTQTAYQGNFGVSLKQNDWEGKNTDSLFIRMGFKGRPEGLKGFLKLERPCRIMMRLEGQDSLGNPITIALADTIWPAINLSWSEFSLPFRYIHSESAVRIWLSFSAVPAMGDTLHSVFLDQLSFFKGVTALENITDNSIKIFPNPSHGIVNMPSGLIGETVEIYQINGQIVDEIPISNDLLNLLHLKKGLYILRFPFHQIYTKLILE